MSDENAPVLLPGGGWRLWEQFALRGPGFPADGVLRLAPPGLAEAADKFGPDSELSGPEWDAFTEDLAAAAVDTARYLQEIAARPRFQAALAWQNPAVLRTGIAPFLRWTPTADSRSSMPRQREELVAHYWQRFCVKNDTIGFFGPVGWGYWDLVARGGVAVTPGDGFLAAREVYFSGWAIDALAKVLAADSALMRWIPPRRVSFVRCVDGTVQVPGRPARQLGDLERAVLERCDGTRHIPAIAAELGLPEDDVTQTVRDLISRRWVQWRLEVPAATHPDRALRDILERVPEQAAREGALERLAVLERGRDAVRAAGTDATALTAAITALEADFATLTDSEAQRAKGERTAPCRGLVYSDTRRAATATTGAALLGHLEPLQLCLTAARWMTNRFAEAVRARLRTVHERLSAGGAPVDLGTLWLHTLPSPHPDAGDLIDAIQAELRAKWARVLELPEGARRVQVTTAELAERVRREFDEPGDGWSLARYISPDVLVTAADETALARGDVDLVLGEMHCALNTMGASLFVHQHPDRDELLAETTRDFPGPRLLPMLPKELPLKWSTRSRPSLDRPEDHYVALVDQTGDPHRPRTVLSADVRVEDRDGRLTAVLPDGTAYDVLDAYANTLTQRVMDRFTLRPEGEHTPRITLGRMTVARETWQLPVAEVDFADEKAEAARFVKARHWQRRHDLPRFVFVVSPTEPRPFYVDFDSPVYLTILAKAARRLARKDPGARLKVSEMLPTPEQAWLTDDEGSRYTSELRFVAVDMTVADLREQ
ncbi:lantibiotic dehydratase [Streptomyces griseofuscus]|uniref:lantibiotic dehydratase n=1 Tax=Streptomyces TaxID=1883 RepID=UPI00081E3BCB|nr:MULTISPECIES: lantibiotic dehydratase [unclassified Streptomyces]MBJ7005133.1 lantibiotic dehydratase [Streptomyces sp. CRPSP2-6A1]MYQ95326.1 lantibiotic dehydratase [Streptomyces sp. SID4946]SCF94955.1 Lantibiotic dehydratase, C terminus [Streptomyces sp. DconLS]SCG04667.1 Lantibiotic dehydratase, C terminus [Streptomyces sp. LamerLS-31b]